MSDMHPPLPDMPERAAPVPLTAKGTPRLRDPRPGEGRPDFVPTGQQRQFVTVWRGIGTSPAAIARLLGISHVTLRKHFPMELEHGLEKVVATMGSKIVKLGLAGNVQAATFYLKNHGGPAWIEKQRLEHTGADGAPLDPPNLVINFMVMPTLP